MDQHEWINVNGSLSAAEAAARLGIKRQTLYAYVSRGILGRTVADDGRTSLFDPGEVERLRQGRRPDTDGEFNTLITTALTRVDDRGLWVGGRDLVAMVDGGAGLLEAADLVWGVGSDEPWDLSLRPADPAGVASLPTGPGALLDALRVITARQSASDPLRHDLSAKGVRAAGRSLIVAMTRGLPTRADGPDNTLPASLWRRLTDQPADPAKLRAVDAAMALLVDHGLAGSTFAARIAASVRADPYSVVSAGLGVLGGTLHGASSGSVHELLAETERIGDASRAAGEVRRQTGVFPGFGHTVYTEQDPRYGTLMKQLTEAWHDDPRLGNVHRVRDVIAERIDAIPNVDLALGALTYLAGMPTDAGECIFAIARTAGWLAHAIEEYGETPLRFRSRARYVGRRPDGE